MLRILSRSELWSMVADLAELIVHLELPSSADQYNQQIPLKTSGHLESVTFVCTAQIAAMRKLIARASSGGEQVGCRNSPFFCKLCPG